MRGGRDLSDMKSGAAQRPLEACRPRGRVAVEQHARLRKRRARAVRHPTVEVE